MRRDMDLLRAILLAAEERENPAEDFDPMVDGYSELQISYHVMLADAAGLLTGINRTFIGVYRWSAGALTWAGHEFINAAKDESVWQEAKAIIAAAHQGGLVFEVLRQVLVDVLLKRTRSIEK